MKLSSRRCRTSGSSSRGAASQAVTVIDVAETGMNVRTVTAMMSLMMRFG